MLQHESPKHEEMTPRKLVHLLYWNEDRLKALPTLIGNADFIQRQKEEIAKEITAIRRIIAVGRTNQ